MKFFKKNNNVFTVLIASLILLFLASCEKEYPQGPRPSSGSSSNSNTSNQLVEGVDYFLPHIDLANWKVTLPIGSGSPTEIKPPEISNYPTNSILKDFMYNDSTDGSLVFYTYPGGATTTNSTYPRTELRELLDGGDGKDNWTFAEGGRMKGTLSLTEISTDAGGNPHRTIIMQIHGRLTDTQKNLIGASDNNAPPMLKIYWQDGRVRVKTKELKDLNATYTESLHTSAWEDDDGFYFSEEVNNDKFTLEIIASEGRMEIIMNDNESKVYEGIHMEKWDVFENYFKAGNYLNSTNAQAFAKVKYYDLVVSH